MCIEDLDRINASRSSCETAPFSTTVLMCPAILDVPRNTYDVITSRFDGYELRAALGCDEDSKPLLRARWVMSHIVLVIAMSHRVHRRPQASTACTVGNAARHRCPRTHGCLLGAFNASLHTLSHNLPRDDACACACVRARVCVYVCVCNHTQRQAPERPQRWKRNWKAFPYPTEFVGTKLAIPCFTLTRSR